MRGAPFCGLGDDNWGVTDPPDYSTASLKILTLREAVMRRPTMYFGDYAASDWPLVIAAWTATELLDYAVGPEPHVDVTLHRDGDLSAAVVGARVTRPRSTKPVSVDELVRRRMWWHHLGRSIAVDVHRNGMPPGAGHAVGDEMVWDDLDIVVRLAFDADLIGSEPQMWWHDGGARLRVMFATDRFRVPSGRQIVIADEAAEAMTRIS